MANHGVPVNLDREGRKEHEEYHKNLEVNASKLQGAGEFAQEQGDRAKEYSDNIETVMQDGPVQTVNGKTGQVVGLAEQTDLDELEQETQDSLNSVNQQLAETAQEVDMTKSELKNKRDKNVKITKSDYDLSQDGNKWNINDLDEPTRQMFLELQGIDVNYVLGKDNVVRENIKNGAIFPEKTTFAKSKNIAELVPGLYFAGSEGNWEFANIDGSHSSYVAKCEPGKSYTISAKGDSDRFRVATSVGFPQIGVPVYRAVTDQSLADERLVTVSLQGDEDYIVVYVSQSGSSLPSDFQIEEGVDKTEYSPPGKEVTIDLAKRKTPYNAIKNLMLQGVIAGSGGSFNINTEKEQIETKRTGGHVYLGDERYFLKDGEFNYSSFSDNTVLVFFDIKYQDIIFVKLSEKVNDENLVFIGVIRRNQHIYSFNGTYSIDGRFINVKPDIPLVKHRSIPQDYKYQLTDYIHVKRDDGGWEINGLYGEYDDLVNKYNFVSRSLFATENVSNLPIYQYDFVLSGIENHATKTIIVTAPHGHEHQSQVATAKFFKDLCERWQEEKILETLKYGYHIIVIPALSPYAVDNGRRTNANGVDLNRNFPEGWTLTDEGTYYSGPEPLSENASQALRDLFINTQNIAFHVDIHNSGADTVLDGWPEPTWIGTNMNEIRPVISEALTGMRAIVDKRYNPTDYNFEIWRNHRAIEGGIVRYANSLGIRSYILEMKWAIDGDYELGQQFNVDMIGNAFTTFVNYSEI